MHACACVERRGWFGRSGGSRVVCKMQSHLPSSRAAPLTPAPSSPLQISNLPPLNPLLYPSSETDASACTSCAAGKYGPSAGASSPTVCIACEEGKANGEEEATSESACKGCGGGTSSDDQTRCLTCGLGSGNTVSGPWSGLSLPTTTGIRVVGGDSIFDANGEVWGRLEIWVGGDWVTVMGYDSSYFGDEEAEVGCRQLGNELGYPPVSWSVVGRSDTPDGSGKQYVAYNCQGDEDALSSCGVFGEDTSPYHSHDVGLRCSFVVAGDECEECPPGKYRYACVCVCREEGMGSVGRGDREWFAKCNHTCP
jgi:hypothetical protein